MRCCCFTSSTSIEHIKFYIENSINVHYITLLRMRMLMLRNNACRSRRIAPKKKREPERERLRSDFDVCASRHRTITTFVQVSEKRRQPTCNFKVEAANACEWIESLFRLPAGIFLISLSSRVVVGGAKSAYNSAAQWRRRRLCESMMFKYIYTTEKKETRRHGRRRECGKILKQTKNIEMKWRKRRTEIEEAFRICE